MSKEKRRNMDDETRARRGLVPWSLQEYNSVMEIFMARRKNLKGNLPLTEEFVHFKDEIPDMDAGELYNFNSMLLVSDIFHQRYPGELEYNAHFFRFHEIKDFLHAYNHELFELGFTAGPEDIMNVKPQLLESLCVLPFSLEETDEEGESYFTFLFEEVVAATMPKLGSSFKSVVTNKKSSNKSDGLDKGFLGLIPWSTQEFNWVVAQYTDCIKKEKAVEKTVGGYLPFKEQMVRMGDKIPENFETLVLLNEIFHNRYPNKDEAMAHFFRYHSIFKFLDKYKNELIKEGLVDKASGDAAIEPELIDCLCAAPYSLEQTEKSGDKSYTFLYSQVVAAAKAKRSARLN